MTVRVHLLADVPDQTAPIGRLRFAEWGGDGTEDDWIAATRAEAGREGLPVTAAGHGHPVVWVFTGPEGGGYYERCGWRRTDELPGGTLLRRTV